MTLQLINNELFFVEYEEGKEGIKQRLCNFLGHDIAVEKVQGETYTIQKGICLRCGQGSRYWKLTKQETEDYKKEMESLR